MPVLYSSHSSIRRRATIKMKPSSSSSTTTAPWSVTVATTTVSTSGSPCAACKFLRRKCQPACVFAPYFPPDQPHKFMHVHKVFGASNVTKLLTELSPLQREDAVNSLAYEAETRLRDPVHGCVGVISLLNHQVRQLQMELALARAELSRYLAARSGQQQMAPECRAGEQLPVHKGGGAFGHLQMMGRRSFDVDMGVRIGGVGEEYSESMFEAAHNAALDAAGVYRPQIGPQWARGGDDPKKP